MKHSTDDQLEVQQIDGEKLAKELGLEVFRRPDIEYQHAEQVMKDLIPIISSMRRLQGDDVIQAWHEKKDEVFRIFDQYPEMWNFMVLHTQDAWDRFRDEQTIETGLSQHALEQGVLIAMTIFIFLNAKKNRTNYKNSRNFWINSEQAVHEKLQKDSRDLLQSSWGFAVVENYLKLFPDERPEYEILMNNPPEYNISFKALELKRFYAEASDEFWLKNDLGPEKLFLRIYANASTKKAQQYQARLNRNNITSLNFYLCQTHIKIYQELLGKVLKDEDMIGVWGFWIEKYAEKLSDKKSETYKVFCRVFGIVGDIWDAQGRLMRDVRRMDKKLQDALTAAYQTAKKQRSPKPKDVVGKIPATTPDMTERLRVVTTAYVAPAIPNPSTTNFTINASDIFKSGVPGQILSLNLSGAQLPSGSTVSLERAGNRREYFQLQADGENLVEPLKDPKDSGNYTYTITIMLPDSHRFPDGKRMSIFVQKRCVKIEAPSEKPNPTRRLPVSQVFREKVEEVLTPPPVAPAAQLDQRGECLAAVAMILAAYNDYYEANAEIDNQGKVTLEISPEHISAVMDGDTDFLPQYEKWTISPSDQITPECDTDVSKELLKIAKKLRQIAAEKAEKERLQMQELMIQAEYETEREKFAPLLDFLTNFTLDASIQKESMKGDLAKYGWALPAKLLTGFVWRHMTQKIKLEYDEQCIRFNIISENNAVISPGLRKCYEEIAQTAARIVLFFHTDTRTRAALIAREKKFHEDIKIGAEAYEALLTSGKARLVVYDEKKPVKGALTTEFPRGYMPSMIDQTVNHSTIERMLDKYPGAELCYRRDALHINGEVNEDASDESLDNTFQNLASLRNSPRARYILKRRILVTLGLEKITKDRDRAPIGHGKKRTQSSISALDILNVLTEGKNLAKNDIDEAFIDVFINQLECNKIRIHYVWPMSVTLLEHTKIFTKIKK